MDMLKLDPDIRTWVTVPIVIIVIAASLIRQYTMQGMQVENAKSSTGTMEQRHSAQVVMSSKLTLANSYLLSGKSLTSRRAMFTSTPDGILQNPPETSANPMTMMTSAVDPKQMANMMKSQALMLGLNGGLAYAVSYLFSGFLVAKIPFQLTHTFKGMLQRGILVPNLDVTYVSSLSWYFLALFATGSIIYLINFLSGSSTQGGMGMADMMEMMPMGMGNEGMMGMNGMMDAKKEFAQELDNWTLFIYQGMLNGCEDVCLHAMAL